MKNLPQTAVSLARNPLGIIALFIVMVYGFASLTMTFAGTLTYVERLLLVIFLVSFPLIVLGVFSWLVRDHSDKLFAPSDFRDENNFLRIREVAANLMAAKRRNANSSTGPADMDDILETAWQTVVPGARDWRRHVLWVDDQPDNNLYERRAFEAAGVRFTLVESTDAALDKIKRHRYAAIISDMGRVEGPSEGYVLLDRLRAEGNKTPYFIYSGEDRPEYRQEARKRGAQGSTADPADLYGMVMGAVGFTA
jgi:CheY-like chemotaxis protein